MDTCERDCCLLQVPLEGPRSPASVDPLLTDRELFAQLLAKDGLVDSSEVPWLWDVWGSLFCCFCFVSHAGDSRGIGFSLKGSRFVWVS